MFCTLVALSHKLCAIMKKNRPMTKSIMKLANIIILTIGVMTCNIKQVMAENLTKNDSSKTSHNTLSEKTNNSTMTHTANTQSEKEIEKTKNCFKLDMNSIIQDSISNLIGGAIFALLLFGLNEYVFRQKNLTGEWDTKNKTTKTAYNPHMKMTIEYKIHLLQLGTQISGRGEKIKDLKSDGSLHHEYPPEKRVELEIEGYYERNFLRRSKLYLLIKEHGTKRTSSTSIELTIPIFKRTELIGNFISTASNSSGTSSWSKIG